MFEVGDHVVALCSFGDVVEGRVYEVSVVLPPLPGTGSAVGLRFKGVPTEYGPWQGYSSDEFRKVQKRKDSLTIESFLTIKPGQFEEPKRVVPAKPGKVKA